jgi:hypothetical protein
MRTWIRGVPTAVGAVALAVVLAGCNGYESLTGGSDKGTADSADAERTTYKLGEASPPQESTMVASKGSTFTVTPTEVRTGTKADMDNSGLKQDDGPEIPVYVSVTLTHKSGKAMAVGDMDDDLVLRASNGQRTRALLVILGQATWPDCPAVDTEKQLSAGESADLCVAFLVAEGVKPAAVELTQGFYKEPLEWPVGS